MNASRAEAEDGVDDDLIDFVPPSDMLGRRRVAPKSGLPLAIALAVGVTVLAVAALWLARPGPAAANAAPAGSLSNVETTQGGASGVATDGHVSLFELPPYDEAQAARDLAAGRLPAPGR